MEDSQEPPARPAARVEHAVAGWPGVSTHPHRLGGVEFRLGRRELGHLREDGADLPFPRLIRDMLVTTGRADWLHGRRASRWVTRRLASAEDADEVVGLFRLSYERAQVAAVRRDVDRRTAS